MDESSITTKPTICPCSNIVSDRVVDPYEPTTFILSLTTCQVGKLWQKL